MKIQYMSDLHFEFHDDPSALPKRIAESVERVKPNVLVLAGDLGSNLSACAALARISDTVKPLPVVYVPGNHEYYGPSSMLSLQEKLIIVAQARRNLHVLMNDTVEIDGIQFRGATMWYDFVPSVMGYAPRWPDFTEIRGLREELHALHTQDREFFGDLAKAGSVFVSHMLPSPLAIAERWQGAKSNAYFVTDMTWAMERNKPKAWIFGHTHDSVDVVEPSTGTRMVCNPYGYESRTGPAWEYPSELNPNFNIDACIEV